MTCIKGFDQLSNKVNCLLVPRSNFALPRDYTMYDMGLSRSIVLCVGTGHLSAQQEPDVHNFFMVFRFLRKITIELVSNSKSLFEM